MRLALLAMTACALALGILAVCPAALAQDSQEVEIRKIEVAPGVYMLQGRGGNIGVSVGEDGIFLVDDQFAPLTDKIVAAIREHSDRSIRFVINTHWHGDHTGGNENMGNAGATIVAHDNVRERMSVEQVMEVFERTIPPSPKGALPVITFAESVTFHLNAVELHAFHVEHAHTDGDAIIVFRSDNTVHMGYIYFNGRYPFIDIGSGGSVDGVIAAAGKVLEMVDAETKIIPGHGPLSNKAELEAYRDMLIGVRDRVQAEIDAGKSEDEVVTANPTEAFDAEWTGNKERFIRLMFKDLSSK